METATIHTYKALKFFKGINLEGKEVDFAPDDIIDGVENWPTFEALKRINWITSVSVIAKAAPKQAIKAPIAVEKEPEKVAEIKVEVKPETVLVKENKSEETEPETTEVSCEQCSKIFNSKRALSVHIKRAH